MNQRSHLVFILLALAMIACSTSMAQLTEYHIRSFDERDGIHTDAEHILTDGHGFLWITYTDRVQRFDGIQMEEFVLDERINSILSDRNNDVWVSTRTGVHLFENVRNGFRPIRIINTSEINVAKVIQLPGREIWLVTNNGFFVFDRNQSAFVRVTDENAQANTPVNTRFYCVSQSDNTLFYGSRDTLWSHDVSNGVIRYLPVKNLLSVNALNDSEAVVSTWQNQSFNYDFKKQIIHPIYPADFLEDVRDDFLVIYAVIDLGSSHFLLSSSQGVLGYNSTTRELSQRHFFHQGKQLPNEGRNAAIHMDKDNQVWSYTQNNLMVFDPYHERIKLLRNYPGDQENVFNSNVRNFAEDEKGNLWLATNNGIAYWDLQKNSRTPLYAVEGATDRMNHPSIRGIAYDGKHVIIGQSNRGLWLYNPVTKNFRQPAYETGPDGVETKRRLEQDFIDQIYPLHNGNYFIAARDGAYLIEKGSYLVRRIIFPGSKRNLNFSYEDNHKQLWVGAGASLHCLDSNLNYKFSIKDGIGSGSIRSMLQWRENEYVVGAKGLYAMTMDGENHTVKSLHPFFENLIIYSMFRDSSDRFWLGTDKGLYLFTRKSGTIETFDYTDNIQGDFFNGNSLYYKNNGMLFMGGTHGVNYFYPDKIKDRNDSLQVSILNVTVNQNDSSYYNRADLLSLCPKENSMEIAFIAPYFGNTDRVQYRYQLAGYSDKWNDIGKTNVVRFTSIPPGQYQFRVAASVNGTTWFESDETLSIAIAFPLWQKWWFIGLCVTALVACLYLLWKKRIKAIRNEEEERRSREVQLITMNRDLASSQLTALRAQMNPHFIFNTLNSMQRYILKGDVDQANKYLSKFSLLQREVLNNSNQEFISLEKEIEILNLYLQLEQLRFDDKFEYQIDVDEQIDPGEIKVPPMVLQPFIENAIWHGLMPLQGHKQVCITFTLDGEILHCTISDNGIGRAASEKLKNSKNGTQLHSSWGLPLVHERLQILEKLHQRPYHVAIKDKESPTGEVEGTEVNVTLHVGA